ncbi:MAG: chemotaxis protein CheW [Lachnospiraceae bacterium]|nr:purine-binding chemotaxis protein CheW [Lachnospiraceae bacterium]MEE0686848.1 chemotaxis protein CheW [Lachnospiraceae bacterium]MEE0861400.1 chemotaxis protein CheW [Lachnospiraceae bacterium]
MSDIIEEFMEEDTQKGMYMTFKSGKEHFGVAVKYVNEIIGIQKITAIPEAEEYIKGLINLRGKIIPVIDVRLRFKQEPLEYNDRTCIIIIDVQSTVIGLIVEKIEEVVTIPDENIDPPPKLVHGNAMNKYVWGLGKLGEEVKLLLDPNKLIKDEDLEFMEDAAEAAQDEEDSAE